MSRLVAIILGAFIGMVAGYFIGAFVACYWLLPESNLCGIVGVFVTAPLGLLAGLLAGWLISRPKSG
jgi:ABC-type dipeptide/oligopeptide/nickel transport system permease subunit